MDSDDEDSFFVLTKPKARVKREPKEKKKTRKVKKEKIIELEVEQLSVEEEDEEKVLFDVVLPKAAEYKPSKDALSIIEEINGLENSFAEILEEDDQEKEEDEVDKSDGQRSIKPEDDIEKIMNKIDNSRSKIKKIAPSTSIEIPVIKRMYQFKVISQLPHTIDKEVVFDLAGNKPFRKIIVATLKHLAGNNYIPNEARHFYKPDNCLLLWKSKIKVYDYMKPDFLSIAPPVAVGGKSFATMVLAAKVIERDADDTFDDEEIEELSDYGVELEDVNEILSASEEPVEAESVASGMFLIRLKDKDGESFEIQVNQDTPLMKIAHYYKEKKKVTGAVKLMFDDEELELDQYVRDTELEDEFEVDVFVQ